MGAEGQTDNQQNGGSSLQRGIGRTVRQPGVPGGIGPVVAGQGHVGQGPQSINGPAFTPTHREPFNFQQNFNNPNTQLAPMGQIQLPQQRFDMMRQNAANQINRSANIQSQDLQRQFGSRGVGRSGLEMQAAQDQYRRGAGQQIGDVNRQLSADEMGQNFSEAQRYRDLESQRRYQQAGLNLQGQQAQAGENIGRGQLGLQEATGLGNLGLAERAQALNEFGARDKWENPGYGLSPLYQAAQAGAASSGGGKK